MTDEQLKAMSKNEANKTLSRSDMYRWVRSHYATANLYFVKDGWERKPVNRSNGQTTTIIAGSSPAVPTIRSGVEIAQSFGAACEN